MSVLMIVRCLDENKGQRDMSRQMALYIHQNPREQEGSRSSVSLTGDPTDIRESMCAIHQVEDIK